MRELAHIALAALGIAAMAWLTRHSVDAAAIAAYQPTHRATVVAEGYPYWGVRADNESVRLGGPYETAAKCYSAMGYAYPSRVAWHCVALPW